MGLTVVNTSHVRQYQLVCAIKYSLLNTHNSFLNEIGEIIQTTTEVGGKILFMTDFLMQPPNLRPISDNTQTQMFMYFTANRR